MVAFVILSLVYKGCVCINLYLNYICLVHYNTISILENSWWLSLKYRPTLTDNGQLNDFFLLYNGVKVISIQWKPYFEFMSFHGLTISSIKFSHAAGKWEQVTASNHSHSLSDNQPTDTIPYPYNHSVFHFQCRTE